MILTYFKLAIRNFLKEKFFSFINILGLSVGISVALLIAIYILHEQSYDRFHTKADRIYRIASHIEIGGNIADLTSTFAPMAEALRNDVPEIEHAVRLYSLDGRIFKHDEKIFTEDEVLYADPDFFSMFDFSLLAGEPSKALAKPYQVLLTPSMVKKYFDSDDWQSVMGQSISINQELYEVTGIVHEAPENSHLRFNAIGSMESIAVGRDRNWGSMNVSTYVLLSKNTSIGTVMNKVPGVLGKYVDGFKDFPSRGIIIQPFAQALTDIHLNSNIQGEFDTNGSKATLYVFGAVALIILLLACVNFVNLTTARSANRAKEVGVRKVLGSLSNQLVAQFIIESVLMVSLATLLALGLVELLRGPFNALSGKQLSFEMLVNPLYLFALILFVLLLGVLTGSYPSFFLASFKPALVLKGKLRAGFRSSKLRNGLVALQFVISIVLITCTLLVQQQLGYMRAKKLGFDKANVIVIDNGNRLPGQQTFLNSLKDLSTVQQAGVSSFKPIGDYDGMAVVTEEDKENRKLINFSRIDHDFLPTLKFEFIEGRNFSHDFPSDTSAIIVNESAAKFLFGEKAVGKKVINEFEYTIIGIVKDFNFESLKNEVRPLVFYLYPNQRFISVRLHPGDYSTTISSIESLWKQQAPDVPFSYSFVDEDYNRLFKEEVKLGTIFGIFTGLALFIACLGLLGLAAYMSEQRSKEIGVRKVLGASVLQVVFLLSKDFVRIISVAFILAIPVTYFIMKNWLNDFAYKTDINVGVLALGGVLVMGVALLAVSYQSIRAALVNPVESLKEE